MQNTVHLNDSHLMSLDAETERGDGRGVDNAQTVAFAALDLESIQVVGGCSDVKRVITPLAVDGSRVGNAKYVVSILWASTS